MIFGGGLEKILIFLLIKLNFMKVISLVWENLLVFYKYLKVCNWFLFVIVVVLGLRVGRGRGFSFYGIMKVFELFSYLFRSCLYLYLFLKVNEFLKGYIGN